MTDSDILAVAKKITKEIDIFDLGLGLKLRHEDIESTVKNKGTLQMAAYEMLRKWLNIQDGRQEAFQILLKTLHQCKLKNIAQDIFK